VREGIVKHSRDLTPGADPELDEYLPELKPPLEAQLIDLADEIAYNTADLDDAYSARMFTLADVGSAVPEFERLRDQIEGQFPGSPERVQFQEVVRMLIDELVSDLVAGTVERAAGVRDYEAVRRLDRRLAGFANVETSNGLKRFLHDHVYFAEPLVAERRKCANMIGELFEYFLAHTDRLPENYVEEMANRPPHRIVCDYIAGMTDGFFMRCFENR
jgi:dGTPase